MKDIHVTGSDLIHSLLSIRDIWKVQSDLGQKESRLITIPQKCY